MPLALYGSNDSTNIIPMEPKPHEKTHITLNLSHKVLRRMRANLNDVLIRTPQKLKIRQGYQKQYFDPKKVHKLDDKTIYLHTDSRVRQSRRMMYEIESILSQVPDSQVPHIDESRLSPPQKHATHQEYLQEHMERLYMMFCLEQELSKAQMEYVRNM